MRRKVIHFIMTSFMVFSLLTFLPILVDGPPNLLRNHGVEAVYATEQRRAPSFLPAPGPNWPAENLDWPGSPRQRPLSPVPEPSTLILLGAGLAAGGAYAFLRYRKRNKK